MEGGNYIHFGFVNIITIWIIAALGFLALGAFAKAWQAKNGDAS
jgi:hypothetical protein